MEPSQERHSHGKLLFFPPRVWGTGLDSISGETNIFMVRSCWSAGHPNSFMTLGSLHDPHLSELTPRLHCLPLYVPDPQALCTSVFSLSRIFSRILPPSYHLVFSLIIAFSLVRCFHFLLHSPHPLATIPMCIYILILFFSMSFSSPGRLSFRQEAVVLFDAVSPGHVRDTQLWNEKWMDENGMARQ